MKWTGLRVLGGIAGTILTLAGCSSTSQASLSSSPVPTAIAAEGMDGLPRESVACPEIDMKALENMWAELNTNSSPITGAVDEYVFCRRNWISDRPPNRHLTMADPKLMEAVTEAFTAEDQTPSPDSGCPENGPTSLVPVFVRTSDGVWLVRPPRVLCGGTVLDDLASQLSALDDR